MTPSHFIKIQIGTCAAMFTCVRDFAFDSVIFLLYYWAVPNAWYFSSSLYCTNKNICPRFISYSVHIIFLLFSKMFCFLYHCEDFLPDLTVYIRNTVGVNCLPFASTRVHPRLLFFFGGVHVALTSFFVCFLLLLFYPVTFWVPCDVRYDFRIQTMFGSSLPPVGCMRARVLFTSFVFVCV